MNTNSTRIVDDRTNGVYRAFGIPFLLLAVTFFSGCIPQPIAHKKVKRPPPDPDVVSTRLGFTSATAPGLLRDDQVKPVTLIVPTFEERSEQEIAAEALSQIGPSALPELRLALQSRDPRIRREAAGVLVRMGPEGKDAVPDLILLLDDDDAAIRKLAARALGRIGPEAATAVPALMRTLLEPQTAPPRQ